MQNKFSPYFVIVPAFEDFGLTIPKVCYDKISSYWKCARSLKMSDMKKNAEINFSPHRSEW